MSNLRSRDLSTSERIERLGRYRLVGLVISLVCALVVFLAVWFINGFTTGWAVVGVLTALASLINRVFHEHAFVATTGWLWAFWAIGMIVHFAVSTIEQHLWRLGNRKFYPLIFVVGFIDTFTASLGVLAFLNMAGVYGDLGLRVLATLLGNIIAILPELMIAAVIDALAKVARHKSRKV